MSTDALRDSLSKRAADYFGVGYESEPRDGGVDRGYATRKGDRGGTDGRISSLSHGSGLHSLGLLRKTSLAMMA